jgi:hypothetical protein
MDSEILPLALVVAFLVTGLAVVLAILGNKSRQRADRLAPAFELGTARPTGFLGSAVSGLYRGYTCRYQIQYASQYDRGGATVRLGISSPNQWSAEVNKTGTRLLSKIGLLQDLEIGDRELDEHLRFGASEEGELRSIFGSEKVLNAMHVLAASDNFESVHVHADRIDVKWSPRMPKLDEDPEILRVRLEYATALAEGCGYPPAHPTSGQ